MFLNISSESKQRFALVPWERMVPAGVSDVSPQRLLSDTVRIYFKMFRHKWKGIYCYLQLYHVFTFFQQHIKVLNKV